MKELIQHKQIEIKGKVVEDYFKEGKQIIKLAAESCYLEFIVNTDLDVHLGDKISFTGDFTIQKINQLNHNNIH